MFQLIENPVLNKSSRITLNRIRYHTWTTNTTLSHTKTAQLSFTHWRVRLHVANDDERGCRQSTGNRPKLFVYCSVAEWGDVALYFRRTECVRTKDYPGLEDSENQGLFAFFQCPSLTLHAWGIAPRPNKHADTQGTSKITFLSDTKIAELLWYST